MNLNDFFARLDGELRAEGMACGPDVWLRVFQLIKQLKQDSDKKDQLADMRQLMLWLRPLFCRNPEEQARFSFLFEQCLTEKLVDAAADNRIASTQQAIYHTVRDKVRKAGIYWWCGGVSVLALLLAVFFVVPPDVPPQSNVPKPPVEDKIKQAPSAATTGSADKRPTITLIENIAPRPQPEPDDPASNPDNIPWVIIAILYLIPWLAVAWLFSKQYFRKLQFSHAPASGDALFNTLNFDRNLTPIWGGAQAERSLRDLRSARLVPTRRLDVVATIEATARSGDYFVPIYRKRRSPPEHVLLVRSLHRNDQQASLAEELAARFQSLGLQVHVYRFRDDPRWLVHWEGHGGDYLQLAQLRAKHETARLLIVSETGILFHPYSGEVRDWVTELSPWQDKVWLHPHDARPSHAQLLAQQNILLLPLARDSLPQLVSHLTAVQPVKLTAQPVHRLALPDIIAAEPDDWLDEQPPHDTDLSELQWQLEHFLGSYGMRLLRAAAVYPKPNWNLTKTLDYLLFGQLGRADPPARREQRLSRLSCLPWLKHGFIPDWLREQLLLNCAADERKLIVAAWQTLFNQLTNRERPGSLHLEISTPSRRRIKLQLREWQAMRQSDAINDPIFANILLGGKFGLLDFHLPRALAKLLPFAQQTLILYPLQLAVLGAALLGTWGLPHYGAQGYLALQQYRIAQDNARWPVTLNYRDDTQLLAAALQMRLQQAQFSVSAQANSDDSGLTDNTVRYPVDGEDAAERVKRSLAWLTYGAEVKLSEDKSIASPTIQVQLIHTYQHGTGFSDELRSPQQPRLPFEPEMVHIPPGKFLMGSPETEVGRDSNEDPQHEVTIAYAFEISKYEITFDEYDAFANATKRKLPRDRDWGRGKRPVISVRFDDAQAYVKWLSEKTGKKYRLPTEAEWEYAARAGTKTAYWWGNDIGKNNANCYACGSEWNGQKTAPVGSFNANIFDLHDTAGNVWEWVEDCWHANYHGAPADGSAWKEVNGGDCSRRVVRGGSWLYNPQNLRSAGRLGSGTGEAGDILGFRIARDF